MAVVETNQIVTLSSGPANDWSVTNPTLPMGLIGYESDTGKFKVGDGLRNWNTLGYAVDSVLDAAGLALLEKAGEADGACVLNENSLIPIEKFPAQVSQHIRYVADIDARDALPDEAKHGIVVVLDAAGDVIATEQAIEHTLQTLYDEASDQTDEGGVAIVDFGAAITSEPQEGEQTGDLTVNVGGAVYVWKGSLTNGMWDKISEFESMDVDFSVYLNSVVETIEAIMDGAEYIKFTIQEREKLELVMRIDDIQFIRGLTPQQLKDNV